MNRDSFKKDIILFLILVSFSGLLIFSRQSIFLKKIRGFLSYPVLRSEQKFYGLSLGFSQALDHLRSVSANLKEITLLQGQLRQLAFEQQQLISCRQENEKMRRLLGAPLPPSWRFLPVKVIGLEQKMKIDQGNDQQVETGMMVITDHILIGRIMAVQPRSSLVETIFDTAVKVPAVIKKPVIGQTELFQAQNEVRAKGLLVYRGGQLIVEEILQEENVAVDDLVLTSGEADWLPDLLIGQVQKVEGQEAELYKTALVKPLADLNQLTDVFVITDW